MKKIFLPRGNGKTTKIIEEAVRNNATIICPNMMHAKNINDKIKRMGLEKICQKPISFSNWEYASRGRTIEKVVIDEADLILQQLFSPHSEIRAISMTYAPKKISKKDVAYMFGIHPDDLEITD